MRLSFLTWINEHLTGSRTRPSYHDALRTSDDLLETKRTLIRFTNDLNAGRIDTNRKILYIRLNVLEPENPVVQSILGTRRREEDRR